MAEDKEGLVCAYLLDGEGGGREVGWREIGAWKPEDGYLWVHLDRRAAASGRWLQTQSGLDPLVCEALLAEESRPRAVAVKGGFLVLLRGVNLNPGSDPEDMVSLRLWIDGDRAISSRSRRLMAVSDLRERLAAGIGPQGAGELLVAIADRLIERMGPTLDDLSEATDGLEDALLDQPEREALPPGREVRLKLGQVRRQAIALRRYLAPQREAMTRLQIEPMSWQSALEKAQLREVSDHITRFVEDLDAVRDRGAVIQDELRNRLAEEMNKRMYLLTVVAAVLLPLSFMTGLLGINVEGIPGGSGSPYAFYIVCALLAVFATFQIWLFRRLKWL